jgi:hypothetical protein
MFILSILMSILYYSNFCDPSKKLLQKVSKTKLKHELHFICIDKRQKDAKGQTIIFLEQDQVILPPIITKVPALFLMEQKQALFGDEIYEYLLPKEVSINNVETAGNGEPECYSLGQMSKMSDSYSFWDQGPEDLNTKGHGGMRQMHNFVPLEDTYTIHTPTEDYVADKVGTSGKTLEQYKAERDSVLSPPIKRV